MNTLQKSEVIYMVYREMAINPIRIWLKSTSPSVLCNSFWIHFLCYCWLQKFYITTSPLRIPRTGRPVVHDDL
jgi:hypothetical protein